MGATSRDSGRRTKLAQLKFGTQGDRGLRLARVLAAVLLFATGDRFDLEQRPPSVLFGTVMAVFVPAITLHRFYWKPSGISDRIANATG